MLQERPVINESVHIAFTEARVSDAFLLLRFWCRAKLINSWSRLCILSHIYVLTEPSNLYEMYFCYFLLIKERMFRIFCVQYADIMWLFILYFIINDLPVLEIRRPIPEYWQVFHHAPWHFLCNYIVLYTKKTIYDND